MGAALLFAALAAAAAGDAFAPAREAMMAEVQGYVEPVRVVDPRVLAAMRRVPRHRFVPKELEGSAYLDQPLPIGEGQTISQPYIVAAMTQALRLKPSHKVLEVGTGSGYQAAVLAELVKDVYTMEILEGLGRGAERILKELEYNNVRVRVGDGYKGWPEAAPFDAVIVTCAPERVPEPLVRQLKVGGRLVIPVGPQRGGDTRQTLWLYEKTARGLVRRDLMPVRFVPMTGEAQSPPR
jgi:protein-L-isoaspartate(D-aspartate) O-methyltransferase